MSTTPRFTGKFRAKVALEALRGDKTIQEIAVRHKVYPNRVSAWEQRAVEGLGEVFSKGAERSPWDHEGEIRNLHAKIGELAVDLVNTPILQMSFSSSSQLDIIRGLFGK